jgi:hypothetical protein
MQGKGAGPVNRVELESQVLCAALRQSCHLKDRVGAFTSVRELSHLFPDLLPPPEKHDDLHESNKANYYGVLGCRPQTSANAVIAAYLRTVRTFLRTQKVADSRVEYNRILNAGFILRKPRLRLSHDLVVARRWLHEESRLAQIANQEVTLDRGEALKVIRQEPAKSSPAPVSAPVTPPASAPAPAPAPSAATAAPPPVVPTAAPPPAVPTAPPPNPVPPPMTPPVVPAVGGQEIHPSVPPVPPLPAVAAAPGGGDGFSTLERKPVEVPPMPPLPVATPQPPVVPPVPPVVNEYWDKQQPAATAVEPPPTPVAAPPREAAPVAPPAPEVTTYSAAPVGGDAGIPAHAQASHSVAPQPPVAPPVQHSQPAPVQEPTAPAYEPPAVEPRPPAPPVAPPQPAVAQQQNYAPPPSMPVSDDVIEVAPGVFVPASQLEAGDELPVQAPPPPVVTQPAPAPAPTPAYEAPRATPAYEAPPPAPALEAPAPVYQQPPQPAHEPLAPAPAPEYQQPVPPPQQAAAAQGGNGASEYDFPPAAVRAQQMAPAPEPTAEERPGGRISGGAAFVFDESELAPPPPVAGNKKVPMLIQLLEAAQFITPVEVQALIAQMAFAPNIPVEKLILNAGYITPHEMASVKLGESLLQSGKINMAQFQVAIYDERTSGLRMAESLQVRGWLSVEVRNAIDEFHKKRQ